MGVSWDASWAFVVHYLPFYCARQSLRGQLNQLVEAVDGGVSVQYIIGLMRSRVRFLTFLSLIPPFFWCVVSTITLSKCVKASYYILLSSYLPSCKCSSAFFRVVGSALTLIVWSWVLWLLDNPESWKCFQGLPSPYSVLVHPCRDYSRGSCCSLRSPYLMAELFGLL